MQHCMDMDMDASLDADEAGQWLTYAELAEIRRIDKQSALKLAIRRKWRRREDNHGRMQVLVPADWAAPRDRGMDDGMDRGMDLSAVIKPLEAAIDTLREQLGRSEQGREAERFRADRAETRADGERSRADQAWTLAQRWAEELAGARALAQDAVQAADDLRRADAARRGLGRLARLRAAWRGE